jgi:hypothetical protein
VSPDFTSGLAVVPDRQALVAWDEAERRRLAPRIVGGEAEEAW